jgi:GalNAc-alpha-(1->4)-GalNAc-alpha-(1->3)-diNAcBac-PP-undecaprenol alpha-1,4-N-acetyl-D-galactosaminyltransferase
VLTRKDCDFIKNRIPNTVVIPNPVNIQENIPCTKRDNTVLAVGNIDRWQVKGLDTLLDVWGEVSHQYPDWRLKIAGGGREENFAYLKALARERSIENTVVFLGKVRDMKEVYTTSSIFVLTSRFEGFPMALAEAMSFGCTCVAFDVLTGPSDIIHDHDTGILVENQNKKRMAEAIASMIEDDSLREEMGKRASKSMQRFSTSAIVDKWESLLHEVVKR